VLLVVDSVALSAAVVPLLAAAEVVSAALVVAEATVVVLASWLPNATQPPSAPTIAAVATADFSRAASRRRFDVSLRFIVFLSA
jgi:hypothetical protein